MRNGFTFKNRHTSEFGVTVKTKSRPIVPSVKTFTADLPCRDGEYDFSASNPQGREHYMPRVFSVTVTVTADTLGELQSKIGRLSLWLSGAGELVFDDLPLVVWRGRISDEIIYMPERGGKTAVLAVSFRAEPFAKGLFGTEGPAIGAPLPIDSAVPLSMNIHYVFSFTGNGEISVVNFGDRPARPVISFDKGAENVTISLGEKTLSFTADKSCTVDFDKQLVTDEDGGIKVKGVFFELQEGANTLKITSSSKNRLTVTVSFTPEYMYGADFSEDRWSDA